MCRYFIIAHARRTRAPRSQKSRLVHCRKVLANWSLTDVVLAVLVLPSF